MGGHVGSGSLERVVGAGSGGGALRVMLLVALVVLALPGTAVAAPAPAPEQAGGVLVERDATRATTTLIGTGTPGDTGRRFGVEGTDLGHMFRAGDRLVAAFGDTYGAPPADPFFSARHADWRSNVLASLDTGAPGDMRIEDMVTDRPGHAKELLASQKRPGAEQTVIPTYGIAVGERMYLHYMSVRRFDRPGHWSLNSAGVASSDDGGRTWTKDPAAVWPGSSRFGQVAYSRPGGADDPDAPGDDGDEADGDTVYVYGIPGGRYGGVSLAAVPAERLADKAAYRYWTGSSWAPDEAAATTIVPAPAGELSVRWNSFHRTWVMMYLVDPTGEIVARTADRPTGPWSEPQVVTSTKQFPDAYAPYLTPMWNDGPDLWFTMSQYGPYRTNLMHSRLGRLPTGAPLPPSVLASAPSGDAPPGPRLTLPFAHGVGMG